MRDQPDEGPPQQKTAVMTPSAKDQLCWKTAEASHRGWLEWNSTWSGIALTTASSFHTTLTTLSVLLCTSLPCQFWSVQTWLPFQFRCVQTWISSLDTILSADMYDQQAHSFFSSFFYWEGRLSNSLYSSLSVGSSITTTLTGRSNYTEYT